MSIQYNYTYFVGRWAYRNSTYLGIGMFPRLASLPPMGIGRKKEKCRASHPHDEKGGRLFRYRFEMVIYRILYLGAMITQDW